MVLRLIEGFPTGQLGLKKFKGRIGQKVSEAKLRKGERNYSSHLTYDSDFDTGQPFPQISFGGRLDLNHGQS